MIDKQRTASAFEQKRGTDINSGVPIGQVSTEKEITFEGENETSCIKTKLRISSSITMWILRKESSCLVFPSKVTLRSSEHVFMGLNRRERAY